MDAMHVPSALAPKPSWLVPDVADVLNEQYPTAGADRTARSIVKFLRSCTKGCVHAPPFEDRRQGAKKEEVVLLSKLRGEDARTALRVCRDANRQ